MKRYFKAGEPYQMKIGLYKVGCVEICWDTDRRSCKEYYNYLLGRPKARYILEYDLLRLEHKIRKIDLQLWSPVAVAMACTLFGYLGLKENLNPLIYRIYSFILSISAGVALASLIFYNIYNSLRTYLENEKGKIISSLVQNVTEYNPKKTKKE